MNNSDEEQISNLIDQIYEQKSLADRYRSALQDIREELAMYPHREPEIERITNEALKEGE